MKYIDNKLKIEKINVQDIAKKYGTPTYCYSCLLYTSDAADE